MLHSQKANVISIWTLTLAVQLIPSVESLLNGSNIECDRLMGCYQEIIKCTPYQDCNITCSASSACKDATIICPTNGNCIINCNIADSCRFMNITATTSTSLTWNCVSGGNVCDRTTLYCPVNGHLGPISCTINGENPVISNIEIYAVEGFNDVQVTGPELQGSNDIFCGENYQINCVLEKTISPYQCPECQNIKSPSQYPTETPTYNPTTEPSIEPTMQPSIHPTNAPSKVTSFPTIYPTNNPSITPSNYPSHIPSVSPSYYPTSRPTNAPNSDGSVDNTMVTTNSVNETDSDGPNEPSFKISNMIIIVLCLLLVIFLCFIIRVRYRKKKLTSKGLENGIVELHGIKKHTKCEIVQSGDTNVSSVRSMSVSKSVDSDEQGEDMYIESGRATTKNPEQIEYIQEDMNDVVDDELYENTNGIVTEGIQNRTNAGKDNNENSMDNHISSHHTDFGNNV